MSDDNGCPRCHAAEGQMCHPGCPLAAPRPASAPDSVEIELDAMQTIVAAISRLPDEDARWRVARYVVDRFLPRIESNSESDARETAVVVNDVAKRRGRPPKDVGRG